MLAMQLGIYKATYPLNQVICADRISQCRLGTSRQEFAALHVVVVIIIIIISYHLKML